MILEFFHHENSVIMIFDNIDILIFQICNTILESKDYGGQGHTRPSLWRDYTGYLVIRLAVLLD